MKEQLSIVSFLQAMRPELATQLTRERLGMVKEITTLRARVRELEMPDDPGYSLEQWNSAFAKLREQITALRAELRKSEGQLTLLAQDRYDKTTERDAARAEVEELMLCMGERADKITALRAELAEMTTTANQVTDALLKQGKQLLDARAFLDGKEGG